MTTTAKKYDGPGEHPEEGDEREAGVICVGCSGQGGGWRIDAAGVVCVICSRHCGGWRIEVICGGEDIRLDSRSKFLVSTRGTRI